MSSRIFAVTPQDALPTFARLYSCTEPDFAGMVDQMTAAWLVRDKAGEVLGALGLRPSPSHGAEVMGGAFPGSAQQQAAIMLLQAALDAQPQLYAYAEADFLLAAALQAAGLRVFSAYTRMSGPLPTQSANVPDGFSIVALSKVTRLDDRMAAQLTYADRIGHTLFTAKDVASGAGGCDDTLSRLAYDASRLPAGICRAWLEGEQVSFSTPGVRLGVRETGLRQALILSVCEAARAAGATQLTLQAWGDTPEERADDLALGLDIEKEHPIYVSGS
ncbi:hypothetical protein [Deinococcus sp.]|uniref:hypothetical protein n=1 Tax=Deinococcus sp. TaxID=47478 RepID=UPI003B58C3A4